MIDRTLVFRDLLFTTHRDRCCYIGLSTRNRLLWLESNWGKWQRIHVQKEVAPLAPAVESETKVAAAPAGPDGGTSSPYVQKDGDHEDVASIDTLPRDCSPPYQPTPLPTPVKAEGPNGSTQTELLPYAEAATREAVGSQTESTPAEAIGGERGRSGGGQRKKQKPPAGTSKAGPKRSLERMLIVLNSLTEVPILWHAASKAGIHRKTLEYWIRCSAAGYDGYDVEWQDVTGRFHELCKLAIDEAIQKLLDLMLQRAFGYDKVLSYRGRVTYKIDKSLVDRGYQGPDAYLKDENGNPMPETVRKVDMKAMRFWLAWHRPEKWGRHRKVDAPHEGGVLVIGGDVTKKPECNTAASVQARKWKAGSRMIQDAKE